MDNLEVTIDSIRDFHNLINNFPPKTKHPFSTPDDETEPYFSISKVSQQLI